MKHYSKVPINCFTIGKYGLPFRYVQGRCTTGAYPNVTWLLEPAIARMYLLEYDLYMLKLNKPFNHMVEKMEIDLDVHVRRLGEFLIDYILLMSIGESRYWGGKSIRREAGGCKQCEFYAGILYDQTREDAMVNGVGRFTSYPETFEQLLHCYYDHEWSSSFGGWKWGNVVYLTYELYKALKTDKTANIVMALDRIMQVQHNGGSALASKFGWFSVDYYSIYRILWLKRTGNPCCYKSLRLYTTMHKLEAEKKLCQHAVAQQSYNFARPFRNQDRIDGGQCRRCGKHKTFAEMRDDAQECKEGCKWCGRCSCSRLKAEKPHCGHAYMITDGVCVCVAYCRHCGMCASEGHRYCHKCAAYYGNRPKFLCQCKHVMPRTVVEPPSEQRKMPKKGRAISEFKFVWPADLKATNVANVSKKKKGVA